MVVALFPFAPILLSLATAVADTPPSPPPSASPAPSTPAVQGEVTVTGKRRLILTVDFNQIWLHCQACNSERLKLHNMAAPIRTRSDGSPGEPVAPSGGRTNIASAGPTDLMQMQANAGHSERVWVDKNPERIVLHRPYIQRDFVADRAASSDEVIADTKQQMGIEAQRFLDLLGARVTALAEARRAELSAAAVQRRTAPRAPGMRVQDITGWLTAQVDRDQSWLEPTLASATDDKAH